MVKDDNCIIEGKAAQEIEALERTLYAKDNNSWEGEALWEVIRNIKPHRPIDEAADETLSKLYQ